MFLLPSKIRFSQNSISCCFGKKTEHRGKLIGETLDDLCEGRCTVDDIKPIEVVEYGDEFMTCDNRRLWVFHHLERLGFCREIYVKVVNKRQISWKKNTTNGGKHVKVRGTSPGGVWHLKNVGNIDKPMTQNIGLLPTHPVTQHGCKEIKRTVQRASSAEPSLLGPNPPQRNPNTHPVVPKSSTSTYQSVSNATSDVVNSRSSSSSLQSHHREDESLFGTENKRTVQHASPAEPSLFGPNPPQRNPYTYPVVPKSSTSTYQPVSNATSDVVNSRSSSSSLQIHHREDESLFGTVKSVTQHGCKENKSSVQRASPAKPSLFGLNPPQRNPNTHPVVPKSSTSTYQSVSNATSDLVNSRSSSSSLQSHHREDESVFGTAHPVTQHGCKENKRMVQRASPAKSVTQHGYKENKRTVQRASLAEPSLSGPKPPQRNPFTHPVVPKSATSTYQPASNATSDVVYSRSSSSSLQSHHREDESRISTGKEPLLVAAIDFGTTNSGYAFSFTSDFLKDPRNIITNHWKTGAGQSVSCKAPTFILFNRLQQFDSFGFEAEAKYVKLVSNGTHKNWLFFKNFKMVLYENKSLDRTTRLKAVNGMSMLATKVFSECIRYLKDHLVETCKKKHVVIRKDDIRWVLTVPAIWDESAKQFMREATINAGISTDCLSLALEPEAASIFCQYRPELASNDEDGEDVTANVLSLTPRTKYLVLDAGGGTIDITVHEILSNKQIKELYKANGGPLGGTKIDEAFLRLLTDIFGQDTLDTFKETFPKDYLEIIRDFDVKKAKIVPHSDQKFVFKIPSSIKEAYMAVNGVEFSITSLSTSLQGKIAFTNGKLRVEPNIAKGLFTTTCHQIVFHLMEIFRQPAVRGTNTIIMVGGFSESVMLQDAIRNNFSSKTIVVPEEAGLVVVKGAVIFGHTPKTIYSRISRFTYGMDTCNIFIDGYHAPSKLVTVDETDYCNDCFIKHVEVGKEVTVGKKLTEITMVPLYKSAKSVTLRVYRSDKKSPVYVDDIDCSYIGKIEIDLSDVMLYEDRKVAVGMIFGETELTVEARVVKFDYMVRANFDCLSCKH